MLQSRQQLELWSSEGEAELETCFQANSHDCLAGVQLRTTTSHHMNVFSGMLMTLAVPFPGQMSGGGGL